MICLSDWIRNEKQKEMLTCPARFISNDSGRQSAKTTIPCISAAIRIITDWGIPTSFRDNKYYLFVGKTVTSTMNTMWRKMKDVLPPDLIDSENLSRRSIKLITGQELWFCGTENVAGTVEGNPLCGAIIDESCYQKPGVFGSKIYPMFTRTNGWCYSVGVPKRNEPGGDEFRKRCLDWNKPIGSGYRHFHWTTAEVVSPDVIAVAKQELDEKTFREQYLAEWVVYDGLICYAYKPENNLITSYQVDPNRPIMVGSDFNGNPLVFVLCQYNDDEDMFYVFDEIVLRNHAKTTEGLDALYRKYGKHAAFEFYGDAASRQERTSASETDYIQICNDRRFNSRIYYHDANPAVSTRISAANSMLCSSSGKVRCKIHERCKTLLKDITCYTYKEDTNTPDKRNINISHAFDAWSYVIEYRWPIRIENDYEHSAPISVEGIHKSLKHIIGYR